MASSKINLGAVFCAFVLGVMTCVVFMNDSNDADVLVNNPTTSAVMMEAAHGINDQLSVWQILMSVLVFVFAVLISLVVSIYYFLIAPLLANRYPVTVISSYMLLFFLMLLSLPTVINRLATMGI